MKVLALLVIPTFFVLFGFAYADDAVVILNTEQGRLVLEFFPEDAPDHVNNFVTLAKDGFYTDTSFHQIIPGLIIQGGDPNIIFDNMTAGGTGDPSHTLDAGFNDIMHERGIVSMFRTDDPNNVGSQFFIVHQDANYLDGVYTVFGRLATHDSYDTLDSIAATTTSLLAEPQSSDTVRILSVEVTTRDEAISHGIPIIELGPPARTGQAGDVTSGGAYTNEELDLMIQFPQGWVVQHANSPGLPDVVAVSTHLSGIPTFIGVYVEDAGNHTFNTMVLNKINDMEEFAVDDDAIIEKNQELSVLREYNALVSDVSFVDTALGDASDAIVKMRQVTVLNEPTGTAYTFSFSADIDDFKKYLVYFDESLHTFDTIREPQTTDDVNEESQTTDTMENIDNAYMAEVTVSAASYDWDSNTLVISFTGRIGPLVNLSHISIVDSYCATVFTHDEYRGRDQDRMSITIEPNELQRAVLASMDGPIAYVRQGAFSDVHGTVLNPSEISMAMTGERPRGNYPCIITYGSNELLLEVHAHNYTQTLQAVHDGFGVWSDLNPDLEFIWVERDPLIWIEWAEYESEYVGLACIWCLGYEATMEIILYGYNCKGERIHHSPDSVRNTVAHELGHILGLEHHVDQTHLMYGEDFLLDPFPTLGYTIPDLLPEGFVGEAELVSRHETLEKILESMSDELDRLGGNLNQFASRHGDKRGDTIYFDTNAHVQQYRNMVGEYNDLVGEYRNLADEYNAIVDDLNCMYEAKPPGH